MSAFRALSLIVLVLTLTVSGVSASMARHNAPAVGDMVLCTGGGMISVSVDAEGRPTGPMLPCPDCLPPMAALAGNAGALAGPETRVAPLAHALRDLPGPEAAAPVHHPPRGPPETV
jgi:hypothetical protein